MNLIRDGADPLTYIYNNKVKHMCEVLDQNPELKDLLTLCFKINHEERPSAEELLVHPFFEEVS